MCPLSAFPSAKSTSKTNVPPGLMVVAVNVVKPPPVMSSLPPLRRFSVVALSVPVVFKTPPFSIVSVVIAASAKTRSLFWLLGESLPAAPSSSMPLPVTDTVSMLEILLIVAVPPARTLSESVPVRSAAFAGLTLNLNLSP